MMLFCNYCLLIKLPMKIEKISHALWYSLDLTALLSLLWTFNEWVLELSIMTFSLVALFVTFVILLQLDNNFFVNKQFFLIAYHSLCIQFCNLHDHCYNFKENGHQLHKKSPSLKQLSFLCPNASYYSPKLILNTFLHLCNIDFSQNFICLYFWIFFQLHTILCFSITHNSLFFNYTQFFVFQLHTILSYWLTIFHALNHQIWITKLKKSLFKKQCQTKMGLLVALGLWHFDGLYKIGFFITYIDKVWHLFNNNLHVLFCSNFIYWFFVNFQHNILE
jgi:hypothetical protein